MKNKKITEIYITEKDKKLIDLVQKEVEEGLTKGLNYTRLALNKDNFAKTNIRKINHLNVFIEIVESSNNLNSFLDIGKIAEKTVPHTKYESGKIMHDTFLIQGIVKEFNFTL